MTIEQLRKAYRAEPFKPFTISLTDGRRFYVGASGIPFDCTTGP